MAQFLSAEWLEAASAIREEFRGQGTPPPVKTRMNLIVTEPPAEVSSSAVNAHMDTTDGHMHMDIEHLEDPDLTLTLDYATAQAVLMGLLEGDLQVGMQAFMSGKIKVQGDMTKLMAMQSATPDPAAKQIAERLSAITD